MLAMPFASDGISPSLPHSFTDVHSPATFTTASQQQQEPVWCAASGEWALIDAVFIFVAGATLLPTNPSPPPTHC